jgi:predicted O-methyltransferase YrrM
VAFTMLDSTATVEDLPVKARPCLRGKVTIRPIGPAADYFDFVRDGESLIVRPALPLPTRCRMRPAALFQQDRGFPDVNTRMGHLLFRPGTTEAQRYTPFTRDPHRRLRELLMVVEATPDDELFASTNRWAGAQAMARALLAEADVPWGGMAAADVADLVRLEPWYEPIEGCVLHALARWTCDKGCCGIEIGSYRGQSLVMLAMALRDAGSGALLISIDPHHGEPANLGQVRLTLAQTNEERRLVQFTCPSDEAWRRLRPGIASFVFIDGEHSYRQVVSDFNNYRSLLAPGGCMIFHDYGYGNHNGKPDVVPDVRPAIDKHVFAAKDFKPLLLAHTLMAFVKQAR